MGITIKSKNYSIDMGYLGFNRLRKTVANLAGEELGKHYEHLDDVMFLCGEERINFFDEYNKKINYLYEKFNISNGLLDFLYASDCEAKISPEKCKQVYEIIKNYDDDVLYGYSGRKDCAKFKDFKEIVKDCIDSKCYMEWY